MKKLVAVVCAVVMLLGLFSFSLAFASEYLITLRVDFEKNLMFSKYDVDVYLDSQRIGTYKHGKDFDISFTSDSGRHKIWFYEDGDMSNSGSIDLDMDSDVEIRCKIECKRNKIKVSKLKINKVASSSNDVSVSDVLETVKDVLAENTAAENAISKETVLKVLMVVTANDVAEDIFTADGNSYDPEKLHDYSYFDSILEVIDEGEWTANSDDTWHIEKFLVKNRTYGGFRQYTFDLAFDGKNYILSNGNVVYASKLGWLDKSDDSKYGEDSLSNPDFYVYLKVSPKQIGE